LLGWTNYFGDPGGRKKSLFEHDALADFHKDFEGVPFADDADDACSTKFKKNLCIRNYRKHYDF